MEKSRENCGVFGIYAPGFDVSRLTFFGLLALQHRGQESAGIAVSNLKKISYFKGMGLVSQVFSEKEIKKLKGNIAIGHTRYSTEGSSTLENAQPLVFSSNFGEFALGHNGNLANFKELKKDLLKNGHCLSSKTDSEIIARFIAAAPGQTITQKILNGLRKIKGAFSLVILTKDKLFAVRDPWGVRPLILGRINSKGWLISSESCAVEAVGGRVEKEIKPGEVLEISKNGIKSYFLKKVKKDGFCIFEYVYFSRPDSIINGQLVQLTRLKAGQLLARQFPTKADFVISVPDSGTSAALGFSQESKIPYYEGLIKSRYIGRTFIQPAQQIRDLGVRLKFSPLKQILKDKEIVLVDDSIVRGTTMAQLVVMLRQAGVKKIHLRIASPPFTNICYLGVDVDRYQELIAKNLKVKEIKDKLGVDSLVYLSLKNLKKAIGKVDCHFCTGCFNGKYPV